MVSMFYIIQLIISLCCWILSLNALSDISNMSRTVDLRDRGEKTILVKTVGAEVTTADEQEYTSVVVMEPVIHTHCEVYSND